MVSKTLPTVAVETLVCLAVSLMLYELCKQEAIKAVSLEVL